jgi:cytosine/adenosine deaminase-related metal-dependent hydrolase
VAVFDAATLGSEHSLGRNDLGEIAAGALANILIIDFDGL